MSHGYLRYATYRRTAMTGTVGCSTSRTFDGLFHMLRAKRCVFLNPSHMSHAVCAHGQECPWCSSPQNPNYSSINWEAEKNPWKWWISTRIEIWNEISTSKIAYWRTLKICECNQMTSSWIALLWLQRSDEAEKASQNGGHKTQAPLAKFHASKL